MARRTPFIIKYSNFLRVSRLLTGIIGIIPGFLAIANGVPSGISLLISVVGFLLGRLISVGIFFIALSVPLAYVIIETYRFSDIEAAWTVGIWVTAFFFIWLLFRRWVFVRARIVQEQLGIDSSFRLSDAPIITAPSDLIRGASGVDRFAKNLERNPSSPLNWYLLGKAMKRNNSLSFGYKLIKAPINPIGTLAAIGLQEAINFREEDSTKLTVEKCHLLSISLAKKRIQEQGLLPEDLLVIGMNYSAISELAPKYTDKGKLIKLAIQYISLAIDKSTDKKFIAESCFYLAELYQSIRREELMLRFANISRKLGFIPAIILIQEYKEDNGLQISESDYTKLVQKLINRGYIDFRYDYRPSISKRLKDSFVSLMRGQGTKLYKSLISLDEAVND